MLRNYLLSYRAYSTILQKAKAPNTSRPVGREFKEISIPVPWGHLAGRWWEPYDMRPILAVHGWQNNLGVFNRLIPLLKNDIGVLTFDLPGHGLSSRLPLGVYYHFTHYLLCIDYIREYMHWDTISLLGHSMGGMLTGTYTLMNSGKIDFTICVDGLKPLPISNAFKCASKSLSKFWRLNSFAGSRTEPPSHTLEEIKQMVTGTHGRSIDPEQAHHMMERSIAPSKEHPGKYYFTRDPRIKLGEVFTFPQEAILKAAHKVTCPVCVVKSSKGSYYEHKDTFNVVLDALKGSSKDFEYHIVEGKHHSILNNPECMVDIIDHFVDKHYSDDRSMFGLDNMVLDW